MTESSVYALCQMDRDYVTSLIANVRNPTYAEEIRHALDMYEDGRSLEDLLFQLGVVKVYQTAVPGQRFSAKYTQIGHKLWEQFRLQLRDVLCGDSQAYAEERAKLQAHVSGALIVLVPMVTKALGLPPEAAGVATVVSLIILKIGLRTFCATIGAVPRSFGRPGEICEMSGSYMNLGAGRRVMLRKGQRFPPGPDGSTWELWEFPEEAQE